MNSISQLKVEFLDGVVVILLTALFCLTLILVIASRREPVSSENSTDTIEKLQNRVGWLEMEIQRLSEENKKMLQEKKLECTSFQILQKGDLFKPVKNDRLLEGKINLLHENQSLENALEELRMEKASLMNEVEKLLMRLEEFSK
ncbi:hypothetical protein BK830_14270 [Listeria monocytogenes]|uniref:Uncharacterized protein n=1 Tax=Listeria monocytogenes TaxID=1639 RepID=A0A823IUI6_LISMN|nr:hypothetical protein [Listeria monocytogenes]EAE6308104.1 hypothetical protein [Listeria monocytogenes]EAE7687800.1 hypothetical protein [Listeria monocytogenes]EAG9355044.1 hypothetical protein [Listeria monocytogenes]RFQ28478.1 hypothetical protein CRD70_14060 [Listeria monocytogenes]UIJ56414.1 hypothetical protein LZJ94_14690 [Listeria monocytogenes]